MSFLAFSASDHQQENAQLTWPQRIKSMLVLAGLLGVVARFSVEESLGLVQFMLFLIGAFVVHQFLAIRFRLPFFFLACFTAIFVLFDGVTASIIAGLGMVLFAIVDAPLNVWFRALLLLMIGAILAYIRLGYWPGMSSNTALSVLGSLFMFRSILYLYEARFATEKAPFWLRLSYFFLLPNLIFLIFPVVDYKTFISNYYSKPAYQHIQQGLLWMANGVLHFLLYRLIYYYLVPNPAEVEHVFGWLQYVIAAYALIVRLAGIFHFSAGVICLFGFDLPPTFRHYFFADSFSDLWRRINRYWRDFVMKVFYYPIYFKVKHFGLVPAIVISILLTFVVNWFLHAYQWLWLKGSVLFTLQDISFWAVFGIAVAGNAVYQAKHRKRKKKPTNWNLQRASGHVLRVMGIFAFMAVLWSWWTAPSPTQWWKFLSLWNTASSTDLILIAAALAGIFLTGLGLHYWDEQTASKREHWRNQPETQLRAVLTISAAAILFTIRPGSSAFEKYSGIDLDPVFTTQLNAMDREAQFQGYYESMLDQQQLLSSPLEEATTPEGWEPLINSGAVQRINSVMGKVLKPNLEITFKEKPFSVNSCGLRDYPTDTLAAPGTLRLALLGGSIEMGSGVLLEETFENLLTHQLNKAGIFPTADSLDILNFSVSGTHMPQHLARLDHQVHYFQPKGVIYVAHSGELRRVLTNLSRLHARGIDLEYEYLQSLVKDIPVSADTDILPVKRGLRPHMEQIMRWGYTQIKERIEAMGAVPIWVLMPVLGDDRTPAQDQKLLEMARDIGFEIIDLRGFEGDYTVVELQIAKWDNHPNALGHQLIADKFFEELLKSPNLLEQLKATLD